MPRCIWDRAPPDIRLRGHLYAIARRRRRHRAAEAPEINAEEVPEKRPPGHLRETVVLVVLSITAVLTAWCGFESSQWSGEMSIAFSEASSARIEAARQERRR